MGISQVGDLNDNIADTLLDARWYPHRFDAAGNVIQFIPVDRSILSAATFLTDAYLPVPSRPRIIGCAEAAAVKSPAPHFIFHSAYCCSTLVANALDLPGVSFGLKEPVMLNDISGWRRRGGQPAEIVTALQTAMKLLGRPQGPGENVIIKPSNVINALAPAMLAASPESQALLLYTPLQNYLASIAKKGMWGRLWVRDLFVKLSKDGLTDYGFTPEDVIQQTDLQIAAIGWLAQHRLFAAIEDRFGPQRIRSLQSENLLANPEAVMQQLCDHFNLRPSHEMLAETIKKTFARNAKTGDSFNADMRRAEHDDSIKLHQEEISKVVIWAEAVAKSAGQNLTLNSPLLQA